MFYYLPSCPRMMKGSISSQHFQVWRSRERKNIVWNNSVEFSKENGPLVGLCGSGNHLMCNLIWHPKFFSWSRLETQTPPELFTGGFELSAPHTIIFDILRRIATLDLQARKMKFLFKKWLVRSPYMARSTAKYSLPRISRRFTEVMVGWVRWRMPHSDIWRVEEVPRTLSLADQLCKTINFLSWGTVGLIDS